MKYIATITFIFLAILVKGQKIKPLEKVSNNDTLSKGQAIIYGSFIQRLGFSSGGFAQDIHLVNIDTKEVFAFRVKPIYKSAKENTFICFIKPGNYAILNYWWTQSKWYGGKMFLEPIFKDTDASQDFAKKVKSGQVNLSDLKRFTFTIAENSINYLGTWHFDQGIVSFTDDKLQLDNSIQSKFNKLDLSKASTVLPK